MRKIALAAIIVLVIAIGGYAAVWHKQANDFQTMVEQTIGSYNDKAKAMGMPNGVVRYEQIQTSGFPISMTITLIKPVFDIPVSLLLAGHLPNSPMQATPSTGGSHWVQEVSYSGDLSVTGNIRGNSYELKTSGDMVNKTIVNNAVTQSFVATAGTPFTCTLGVEQPIGGAPWTMQPVFTDVKTFLQVFRSIECSAKDVAYTDPSTHAKLMSADAYYIKAVNEPENSGNHAITFATESKNLEGSPAIDKIVYSYMQMAYALMGTPQGQQMAPIRLSQYGKQNASMDVRYDGPVDNEHLFDPNMRLKLDINKFIIESAIINQSLEMHLSTEPEGNDRSAAVKLHATGNISQTYDAILIEQTAANLGQAMQTEGKTGPQLQVAMTLKQLNMSPQQLAAIVMPDFHSFGDMAFDIDARVKGPNHGIDLFKHGNFTLDAFNWIAAPYGVTLKGKADFSSPDHKPYGEFVKTCIHCDALISDLGAYAMRIDALGARMQPPHPPFITPALVEGVRQFIHGIAENGNAKDLVTDFKFDASSFTVSGKSLPQLLGLYMSTIAPVVPHGQPQQAPGAAPPSQLAPPTGR